MNPFSPQPGRWVALAVMLLGLPPAGVLLRNGSLAAYLEFPPRTRFIEHAAFSWLAFILLSALVAFSISPLMRSLARRPSVTGTTPEHVRPFPWWGWGGVLSGGLAWILAWTRFAWFAPFQPHTFPLLWGSFILVVNALAQRRTGTCLMSAHPAGFLALFPVSACFWWFFEFLNRFVQNWYYTGADYPPLTYFVLASISFATVLPAVLSVRYWLMSYPGLADAMNDRCLPRSWVSPKAARWVLMAAACGLLLAGAAPDYGFPFLWLSPLAMGLAFQVLRGDCPLLHEACRGRWTRLTAAALSGLFCGIFWEMWNFYSLARWSYAIPFVDRFHLFEMPLLGYAGYLPFGLECALVGDVVLSWWGRRRPTLG